MRNKTIVNEISEDSYIGIILFRREFVSLHGYFYPCEMKGNNTLADLKGHTYQETRKSLQFGTTSGHSFKVYQYLNF